MASVAEAKQVLFYHEASSNEAARVGIAGVLVGILVPLAAWAISQWALKPIFCQDVSSSACTSSDSVGYYVATVVITAIAVPVLASWGVFRGLLVAVSAGVALWGLQNYLAGLTGNWLEYGVYSALLFGLAYVLFYWLMRLRNFGMGLAASLVVVLVVRWALLT